MEIRKEDFVKFRIVNTFFYALPVSFFEEKLEVPEDTAIVEVIEPTPEDIAAEEKAIAKATKKAELEAELAALEE